ncbi:hypothetical protein CDAR_71052 [Caerostris darwini]|uniref:Proactivator polypeptide n=1 Tax=Caerostris darwini TaxID=1538125 RepID=A0AAV4WEM8_9ARAC|nr:hypothetical protein CDAR_71052 [Caerostris darwini]
MKLLLCALCALLGVLPALAFPTPGLDVPPQCIDPTFACQDLESAKLCKVVKTCIHDIWATMTVPDSNDEVCDICKEMVKEARDQLLSNMTQEEIKEVFEGSCKLLPIKILAEGCIKVVDEIIPQLVEMLASRMDPTMVCTVSGMCFPSKKNMELEKHIFKYVRDYVLKNKNSQCAECTQMMTDVQAFLQSTPEDEAKIYMEKFCHEKLPSYLCNIAMNEYFHEIYTYIKTTDAAKMCSSVGVCPQKCEVQIVPKVEDDLTCEFCEHLIQHVKDLITANTTMEEFRTALLNFCKKIGKWSDKCTNLVNDYYDMLFNYIKELDTKGMCTLMGLCSNQACTKTPLIKVVPAREAHRKIPLMKLRPAHRLPNLESFPLVRLVPAEFTSKKQMKNTNDIAQLPLERLGLPIQVFQKDTDCALCKAFSFYLEKEINGDNSKDSVRNAFGNVCEKWMIEYPEHCHRIVNMYSLKMQMAIAKGISFDDLCPEVKVCPLEEDKSGELNVKVIPKIGESPFCDLCKEAFNEVEKTLKDPAIKQKLKDSLDQVCNMLPKSFQDDCKNFVNQNVDALIDILEQELAPDSICPALKLCGSQKITEVPKRVKDLECDVCKDVVSSLRTKLQDPASKTIVLTFFEEGCMRLPAAVASECKQFVDENIDFLMNTLVDFLDPQKVCSILKICPAQIVLEAPKISVNNVECDLCKQVVNKVEDMVNDEATEEQLMIAMEKVCGYLSPSITTECEEFVSSYGDMIVALLVQQTEKELVCPELQLCPAQMKLEAPKSSVNDVECELCKEVVGKVEDMVKDQKTVEEIKAALDKVCSYLPSSFTTKCVKFVNTYTDMIVTLLMQELTPDLVCAELNLCPAQMKLEAPKSSVNDAECELCKEVVGKVEDMVKDQKTVEEIKAALDKVCSYLPSSFTSKCENFVNTYTDIIVTLLMQELDPALVCAELKLCPAQIKLEAPKSSVKDAECDLCKEVVGKVEDMVKDKKSVEEIKAALDKVCSYLPSSFTTKCVKFVNTYTDMIVTLLMQELDPALVCAELKLCTAQIKIQKPKDVKDLKCDLCKIVVSKVEEMVKDKKTEAEIQEALDKVCSILPTSLSAECQKFVDQYAVLVINLLAQNVDPVLVCGIIQECPTKGMECQACQYALHFIQELLMGNETQEKVKDALKSFCHILPEQFSENCESFIDEYGASLLVLVAQEIDPSVMCLKMQLCPSKELIPQLKGEASEVILNNFLVDECSVCTTVVDYIDKLLEEDDVDKELTKLVEKVCTVLPASYQEKCASTLEAYGPYILQMIGQMASSKEVCQEIDLCPRTRGQVHLIGGSKCTFGPSYWCHSAAHAAACKAEMYCKTKVWEN